VSQEELNDEPIEFAVPPLFNVPKAWPPRTNDGMKLPHRMNWLTFVRAVPGIFSESGLFDTRVPDEFVTVEATKDGEPVAVIACPCGATPSAGVAESVACDCSRIFLNIGQGEIRVFQPPEEIVD
jgi:hypothetical protein